MKYLFPLIMTLVMITVLVASNIYISKRLGWIFSLDSLRLVHILVALVPVLMFTGLIGFSNSVSIAGHLLYSVAAITTGIVLYLLVSMLAIDVVTVFYKLKPALYGILVLGGTLLISAYGLWNATNTKLIFQEIGIKNLEREVKVMHFSDIHLGHFRGKAYLEKITNLAIAEKPDFVVITGDLFDGRIRLHSESLDPLREFKVPVYFVEGNHDKYSGVKEIKGLLRSVGVRVLENEVETFKDLQIIGLNHMAADSETRSIPPNPGDTSIERVLAEMEIDSLMPSVLLHHSPHGMKHVSAKGVDLYLSGHTHGGQLFPITLLNDLLFKYNKGLHAYKGTQIFVSRGAGTFGPPMRVGARSEVVLLTLQPEASSLSDLKISH